MKIEELKTGEYHIIFKNSELTLYKVTLFVEETRECRYCLVLAKTQAQACYDAEYLLDDIAIGAEPIDWHVFTDKAMRAYCVSPYYGGSVITEDEVKDFYKESINHACL